MPHNMFMSRTRTDHIFQNKVASTTSDRRRRTSATRNRPEGLRSGSSRPEGLRGGQEELGEHLNQHVGVAGLMVQAVAAQHLAREGRELLQERVVGEQVDAKQLQNLRARSVDGEPERVTPL